jgi:hypothetical protein
MELNAAIRINVSFDWLTLGTSVCGQVQQAIGDEIRRLKFLRQSHLLEIHVRR